MKPILETTMTAAVSVAALVIAGSVAYRTFFDERAPVSYDLGNPPPVQIGKLRALVDTSGLRIGTAGSKVTIAAFIDFECPFCARYALILDSLRSDHPGAVSLVVHHFPLRSHRFAQAAAQSAECADEQGHFAAMHSLLLAKQDSFGLKSWPSYALEAGVSDSARFLTCFRRPPSPRIAAGMELGETIGVRGTPTFVT